jgi:hypothetical protein
MENQMNIKNLYRTGLDESHFANARIAPDWGVLRVISEEDLQAINGGIILTGSQAEAKVGVLFFQLVNAGAHFRATWDAADGDLFLISHLAGDRIGQFVFVESADVLMKYGRNVFTE